LLPRRADVALTCGNADDQDLCLSNVTSWQRLLGFVFVILGTCWGRRVSVRSADQSPWALAGRPRSSVLTGFGLNSGELDRVGAGREELVRARAETVRTENCPACLLSHAAVMPPSLSAVVRMLAPGPGEAVIIGCLPDAADATNRRLKAGERCHAMEDVCWWRRPIITTSNAAPAPSSSAPHCPGSSHHQATPEPLKESRTAHS
jgi:hypothetical protein